MKIHGALLASLALLLAGCGTTYGSKNVFFGDQRVKHAQEAAGSDDRVIRIYFDRVGDLYPGAELPVDDVGLRQTSDQTLLEYFSRPSRTCTGGSPATELQRALCELQHIPGSAQRKVAWAGIQDQLFEEIAGRMARAVPASSPLVILIHGYRVGDAEKDYRKARAKVAQRVAGTERPVFLQVHWDGLTSPTPAFAWSRAQANGFLVGFSLRRVLRNVPQSTSIRVMTHSSGAFVLSSAVGDPGVSFGRHGTFSEEYEELRRNAAGSDKFPIIANRDFRAGMIVPATPPGSFAGGRHTDFGTRAEHTHAGVLAPVQLIVGANPRDIGVTKALLPGNWSLLGSTSLGTEFEYFCDLRRSLAARREPRIPAPVLVDMRSPEHQRAAYFWDTHDWSEYMDNDPMNTMLDLLFNELPGEGHSRCPP